MEKFLDQLKDKCYLGDGVYCGHDGYQIWLVTEGNKIAIDPYVFKQLVEYAKLHKKDKT